MSRFTEPDGITKFKVCRIVPTADRDSFHIQSETSARIGGGTRKEKKRERKRGEGGRGKGEVVGEL